MSFAPYLAAVWLLAAATLVFATTADDVCAPGVDPCVLQKGTTLVVTDGSVLDFGSRAFVLPTGSGTKLDIGSGEVTIRAGSMTLNAGSSILGSPACTGNPPFPRGGRLTVDVAGDFVVLRDGNAKARIDVSNCTDPGGIFVQAGGDVRIEGTLTAQGTQADAGFGTIEIFAAGEVLLPGEIVAAGGVLADGGDLFVRTDTGDVNVSGTIDVSGGNGGSVAIAAGGRLVTSERGILSRIDGRANAGGGTGGIIDLSAAGDVTIGSPVHAQGEPDLFLGGDGGEVLITAGGSVTLGRPVNLFGTVPDGVGGDADVFAALDIEQQAPIDASGKRTFGAGGLVSLLAERHLTAGSIDAGADCEECAGGDLALEAWCSLTVPAGAILAADGPVGIVGLRSGGPLVVQGTVRAGGAVEIAVHPSGPAPDLTGSTIVPAPSVFTDGAVVRCGGPGVCDLDGQVETGEECDDGNDVPCDGCSNTCKIVACGNGRLDTPCEECDDGNALDCDGCRGDCTRPDDVCGDGIFECSEACDPGTSSSCDPTDTCSATCALEACGNGVQECLEACDEGEQNGQPGSRCAADCTRLPPPNCGDMEVQADEGEQCDDGNAMDCDDCNRFCETESCGNNVAECLEECDDGNASACDGCTPTCLTEACGNDRVDCGEECDEGEQNGQPGSACLADLCLAGQLCTTESTGPCIPCGGAVDCDPLGLCAGQACLDGTCTGVSLDCDDGNVCTLDGCEPATGCTHELQDGSTVPACDDGDPCTDPVCTATGCSQVQAAGFDSVHCRLAGLAARLAGDGLDDKARRSLGKLHAGAVTRVEAAAGLADAGKTKKAAGKLGGAAKKLTKFGKKVVKLQPAHVTDPTLGAALSADAADATARINTLRETLAP